MRPSIRSLALVSAVSMLSAAPTLAQEPAPSAQQAGEALLVFLDCQVPFCDFDHFRREISFVNWMRDRQDAQVHVLVTAQMTGGGGWEFTFAFIGREEFTGQEDTLTYTSRNTDTSAEVREGLTQALKLGLVRYAARTPLGSQLLIDFRPEIAAAPTLPGGPEADPWNLWTFRVSLNGSMNGESQQSGYSVRGNASASRTTENFKINLSVFGRYNRDEFELDDTTTFVDTRENYSADALLVWSLGPHWSLGLGADANRSTRQNFDLSTSLGPAVEYNIFPYEESTRQAITFLYRLEGTAFDYQELTVENKTSQVLTRHSFGVAAAVQQPWGQLNMSVRGTQYLHDLETHRIDTFGGFNIRLFRGLSFNMFGNFSRIKDQFFLPAAGLTEEEILRQRRARETDYRFRVNAGFSFRFGSKFNNVVNPRIGGGGMVFFF
ncbi:MAG: hypothetical protein ACE5PT_14180 [Gemmatimonadales bacterium]